MNPLWEIDMYAQTLGGRSVLIASVLVIVIPFVYFYWKSSRPSTPSKPSTPSNSGKQADPLPEADDFEIYENAYLADGDNVEISDSMSVASAMEKCRNLQGCVGFCHKGGRTAGPVQIFFKEKWNLQRNGNAWTSYFLRKAKEYRVLNTNPNIKVDRTSLRKLPTSDSDYVPGVAADGRIVEDCQVVPEGDFVKVKFVNDFGLVEGWIHHSNLFTEAAFAKAFKLGEVVEVEMDGKWSEATVKEIRDGVVYAKRYRDLFKWPCKPHHRKGWDGMRKVEKSG